MITLAVCVMAVVISHVAGDCPCQQPPAPHHSIHYEPRYPSHRAEEATFAGPDPVHIADEITDDYDSDDALPKTICIQLPPGTPLGLSRSILQRFVYALADTRNSRRTVVTPVRSIYQILATPHQPPSVVGQPQPPVCHSPPEYSQQLTYPDGPVYPPGPYAPVNTGPAAFPGSPYSSVPTGPQPYAPVSAGSPYPSASLGSIAPQPSAPVSPGSTFPSVDVPYSESTYAANQIPRYPANDPQNFQSTPYGSPNKPSRGYCYSGGCVKPYGNS
ncbi:uncharacterized protein LOC131688067 [Topomyia yanbarensis]|uniref:uncharacterized protein LOC131688067 n=1 Tax=Topomyia yanbarensis TaxID=2498891 RepID=UPI00273AE4F6|nr:uncharacterized protein LOC131688067 [Topomyia yanbarensis]